MSRRALRMERQHKRHRARIALSMVSLMDIFTILVFFLLVHSSNVQELPTKAVRLPESAAEQQPKQTIVVTVNDEDILVQGRKVASVSEVLDNGVDVIEALKAELDYQAQRGVTTAKGGNTGREVTIMGDKEIPYRLLKKIMLTCVRASYDNISLAVLKKVQT
jgi:biopolymer transport protein TolR